MCRWASPAKSFLVSAPRWDLSVPEIDKITEHRKKFCNGEFLKYCHVVKYNRLKCDRKEQTCVPVWIQAAMKLLLGGKRRQINIKINLKETCFNFSNGIVLQKGAICVGGLESFDPSTRELICW